MAWWLSCILYLSRSLSERLSFHYHYRQLVLNLFFLSAALYILALALCIYSPELYEGQILKKWNLFSPDFIQLLLEFLSTGTEHGHAHIHLTTKKLISVLLDYSFTVYLKGMPISCKTFSMCMQVQSWVFLTCSLLELYHNIPISIAFMRQTFTWENKQEAKFSSDTPSHWCGLLGMHDCRYWIIVACRISLNI